MKTTLSFCAIQAILTLLASSVSARPNAAPKAVPREVPNANPEAFPVISKLTDRQLSDRQLSDTRNDLSGACQDVTVIFARGTTESGNVGASAGPPFFSALQSALGTHTLAVQGVDYAADIAGFIAGGDATGSATMASLVNQAITKCPSTKVVMSGYSQGGQLVHNAAKQLSAANAALVNSVVVFGDPDNGQAVGAIPSSKVDIICHTGDNICQGGVLILAPHLTYSLDAGTAAAFVKTQTGF